MNNIYKIFLSIAAICLLAAIVMFANDDSAVGGPLLIAFFVLIAISFRGFAALKGFTYTIMILAAVTTALCYPQYFTSWNGFVLSSLIKPLIMLIMFGMGTSMSIKDFAGVIKMPKGVFIGVVSHFIIMPLIGFTLASLTNFPPEIAAGIVLVREAGGLVSDLGSGQEIVFLRLLKFFGHIVDGARTARRARSLLLPAKPRV